MCGVVQRLLPCWAQGHRLFQSRAESGLFAFQRSLGHLHFFPVSKLWSQKPVCNFFGQHKTAASKTFVQGFFSCQQKRVASTTCVHLFTLSQHLLKKVFSLVEKTLNGENSPLGPRKTPKNYSKNYCLQRKKTLLRKRNKKFLADETETLSA